MSTKPLIFVYPLTETMKKLKESVEGIAQDEGYEIYEVDDLVEVAQLVPTIGQSLSIYGNPKKCAGALKQLRKVNAKLNSKILLINEKKIPRKTLDKFSKIGLTEFIHEPVAPKTLLYKVKLQLKSIIIQDEEEEEEEGVKSLDTGETEDGVDESEYNTLTKKSEFGEEDEYGYQKGKKKSNIEIAEEEEKEKKKSNYQEEAIGTHWGGKLGEDEEEGENLTKKTSKDENEIDGFLRGETSTAEDLEEEEEERKKKALLEEDEEDLYDDLKERSKFDLEEESEFERKRKEEENLEEDLRQDRINDEIAQSAYYKGKVKRGEVEEEEEEKEKKKKSLLEEDDEPEIKQEREEDDEEENEKKKDLKLELEEEEAAKDLLREDDEEEEDNSKDVKLEVEESDFSPNDKTKKEELIDEEDKDARKKEKADEIDKYYRGGVAKKDEEDEEDGESKDLHLDKEITLDDGSDDLKDEKEDDDDIADYEDKKKKALQLEDEDEAAKDRERLEEDESGNMRGSVSKELDLEDDTGAKDLLNEEEDDDFDENGRKKKNNSELLIDDDGKDKEFSKEELEGGDFARKKLDTDLDFEHDKGALKANSKTDKIESHYSSKKSVSHVDDDWDFAKNKKDQLQEDEKKKKSEMEISFKQKVDLGEQTIDYRKLREEFGGITMDREGNKEKRTGPKYYGGEKADDSKTASYYGSDLVESDQLTEEEQAEEDKKKNQIFEPNDVGLHNAVKVLALYYKKDSKPEEAYNFITSKIKEEFKGHTSLFLFDRAKGKFIESFSSLSLFTENEEAQLEEVQTKWNELEKEQYETWNKTMLPTWTDETFQADKIQFIYPFYEGATSMGYAVTWLENGFKEDKQKILEVYLETLRGFYLNKFHEAGNTGSYNGKKTSEKKEGKLKSFFGGLFGKKAG
ncbi:hypothetical protein A9Q84_02705 [Halobacteriovorax marinus]|uniref:Uncharacterized protein n=1 Tax=Halobacteriovorax marinus TaxID=97084 RepID=A0A1Y5FCY7_9BACT|nr:hypothetical protein A9Q84_02705 [Halobacteriovorax marinus]